MRSQSSYDSSWNTAKRGFMRMPVFIRSVIAISVAVFVLQAIGGSLFNQWFVSFFGFRPELMTALTQPWRWFTYMFIHASGFHILFNMLWLWWMGRAVEERLGAYSFSVLYLGAGIGGALLQLAASPLLGAPVVIGASGAVLGVMVAFAMLYPTTPIMLLFFPPIEARFFVAIWVVLDLLFLGNADNIARIVHLGGAGTGYLLIRYMQNGGDLEQFSRWVEPILMKMKGEKVFTSPRTKRKSAESYMRKVEDVEILDEEKVSEMDRILEKISQKGYDSLTKEEKQRLFDMSKRGDT